MSLLAHEVGNFHRDESNIYFCLSKLFKDPVKRGVALGSIIKNEDILEKLSSYKYPVYGFLHNDVPVIILMPMDSSEHFINPPIQHFAEDVHNVSDDLFETLISNDCMVISIGLRGEWNIHYKECFVTINGTSSLGDCEYEYCIDYMISRYDECAYLTGTFFNNFYLTEYLCNGLKSELNKRLDFNDIEAYYKAVAFLNIVKNVTKLTGFISTNRIALYFMEDSIFYQPSSKFKYFCRYCTPILNSAICDKLSGMNNLFNAKELSSLVYLIYQEMYKLKPSVGVVTESEIADSFCEKVPFYASRLKNDFRRPYELADGIYADGNLSVDRALLKARKAIMDLGLNPYDFKYKYENINMLLGTGILV